MAQPVRDVRSYDRTAAHHYGRSACLFVFSPDWIDVVTRSVKAPKTRPRVVHMMTWVPLAQSSAASALIGPCS